MTIRGEVLAIIIHHEICGCGKGYKVHGDTYEQIARKCDNALLVLENEDV